MTASQQAQITQFLSAAISQPLPIHSNPPLATVLQPEVSIRTDFSNLFQSSAATTTNVLQTGPNSKLLAIAAEKAKNLLKAKNITDSLKIVSNGNSVASNGNESSQDGKNLNYKHYNIYVGTNI